MADDVVKLNLRLPKNLHRQLVQRAKRNKSSLNSEIINEIEGHAALRAENARLMESVPREDEPTNIRPRLRGLIDVLATVMDVAGRSRFGLDTLYSPGTVPDWLNDRSGFAVAAAAAAHVLDELHPKRAATFSDDPESLAEQAEIDKGYGQAVAQELLERIAFGDPDGRTEHLRRELGPLVERIERKIDPMASGFEPVWIRAKTPELRAQHAEARRREEANWPDDDESPAPDDNEDDKS
jgi:hypothetical protein